MLAKLRILALALLKTLLKLCDDSNEDRLQCSLLALDVSLIDWLLDQTAQDVKSVNAWKRDHMINNRLCHVHTKLVA